MDNVEKILELGGTGWVAIIIVIFSSYFLIVELTKGFDVLKGRFGFWESKTSRRIAKLEERLSQMENDMGDVDKKIDDTRTEFNDREIEHWDESKQIRNSYDDRFISFNKKLDKIIDQLEKRESLDFKKLRNQIVQLGEDAIDRGSISIRKLKSLEELYSEYVDKYDGNSYVQTLMKKVRDLPVIGKLNEHGEDIED